MMNDFDLQATPQYRLDPEAARAFYLEHGFHVEFDTWEPAAVEALNAIADGYPDRAAGDCRPLMHPHRTETAFEEALRNPRIVSLMDGLLGGRISGLQTEYFFGAPGTKGFALHQDNFYLEAEPNSFGSAWSAMADVSPQNGGVFIFPGTHREPVLPTRKLEGGAGANQDPNAANEECIVPPHYKRLDLTLPAGSTVVLHGHLVHGSYTNGSNRFRRALLCTYILKGHKFRAGNTARRVELEVYSDA